MLQLKPYSALFLTLEGFLIMTMGAYFVFLRPPLLPEDLRHIGLSLPAIQNSIPNLLDWMQKVFWVMGGYIFTTGLITVFVAQTVFRLRTDKAFVLVLIAGITSVGSMTIINFILDSDFKWVLSAFTLPWIISLILYRLNK